MAVNKTKTTDASVSDFINAIADDRKREDSLKLQAMITEVTGFLPKMHGPTIIGFGNYHYKYASGHEGDAPLAGFSPRNDAIVLYIESEFPQRYNLIEALGKCKISKVCVYIKKMDDIDINILKEVIKASVAQTKEQYPE
jgi:nucleoid DNA-binding protein